MARSTKRSRGNEWRVEDGGRGIQGAKTYRVLRKRFTFTLNGMRSPWRILNRGIARSNLHLTIKINLFVVLKNKIKEMANLELLKLFRRLLQ